MSRARNFLAAYVSAVAPNTVNTEFSVANPLQTSDGVKIPARGAWPVGRSGAGSLYLGSTAWTTDTLYFKSDAVNVGFAIMVLG